MAHDEDGDEEEAAGLWRWRRQRPRLKDAVKRGENRRLRLPLLLRLLLLQRFLKLHLCASRPNCPFDR